MNDTKRAFFVWLLSMILSLTGCGSDESANSSANSTNEDIKEESTHTNYGKINIEHCINIGDSNEVITKTPIITNGNEGIVDVIDCYSLKGRTFGEGDKILSVSEIKSPQNLNNFDFSNIWIINELYGGIPHPFRCDENAE